jgi:hypothetical protein
MTRLIVKDMGIDGNEWNSKFFGNVHRMIFGKKKLKRKTEQFVLGQNRFLQFHSNTYE